MSTLSSPRIRPPKRHGTAKATSTYVLQEMNAQNANDVVTSLANKSLEEYVPLGMPSFGFFNFSFFVFNNRQSLIGAMSFQRVKSTV